MKITKRRMVPTRRPRFTTQDALFLLELPGLLLTATCVPERHWATVCFHLERLKARIGLFSPAAISRGLALMGRTGTGEETALQIAATRSEHHMQIVRERTLGWRAPLKVTGQEHISEALSNGRGAVLWIAHFSFNALASKKALYAAGFRVSHLSRPEHGFSKSRFGIAVLNPIRVGAELRYLRDRIIIDRNRPLSAVQQARRYLEANRIISITAGAWEGGQVASVEIGGCRLEIATGAPGLAYLTGAALLPVFTLRDSGTTEICVAVDAPILIDRNLERNTALLRAS